MRFLILGAALSLFPLSPVRADDYEISKLREQWNAAEREWKDRQAEASDKNIELDPKLNPLREFRTSFRLAAQRNIENPTVLPVLIWMIMHADPSTGDAQAQRDAEWAMARLKSDYIRQRTIGDQLRYLAGCEEQIGVDAAVEFFEQVARDNPDRNVQAEALLQLAQLHQREGIEDPNRPRPPNKAQSLMASKLFNTINETYADTPAAKRAMASLFDLRNLQLGMAAPELEGLDENGKKVKLADFRGKVVVVDFWGYWCSDCRRQIPRLRALYGKLKNKPFVILGINSDENNAALLKALKSERIEWPNIQDGPPAKGQLSQKWNVHSWPTVFVIDQDGLIRGRNLEGKALEHMVIDLIKTEKPTRSTQPNGR